MLPLVMNVAMVKFKWTVKLHTLDFIEEVHLKTDSLAFQGNKLEI